MAQTAGTSTWGAIVRLRELIASKFRDDTEAQQAVATLATNPSDGNTADVATRIDRAASTDPQFRTDLQQLVTLARADRTVETIVSQAFDSAKQVNIHGDHHGPITL
ncbi:hypothetical protein [Nocardia sp. CA-119907]|uniref:hypothetical protein n=1 Tax=Nocardia sp. CA-119907 TaxID=3239973 RepID=UPI003D97B50B